MAPSKDSTKSQKAKKGASKEPPFPSPTNSDGPPVPPPRSTPPRTILLLARSGRAGFNDVHPTGFPPDYNMCYRNAALSLLMNITPFVGYVDQFSMRSRDVADNVLLELGDMATAYWSDDSDEDRREKLGEIIDKLWAHLLYLDYDDLSGTVGWGPFLDSQQREMQQDAGDFLENLLNNGAAECQYRPKDRVEYDAMVEATFQLRRTCAGNCEDVRTRGDQIDRTRLWTVDIDHSKGAIGGTLEDAVRTTMTNEIDLSCKNCKKLGKKGKVGRIWLRLRDAPEILFIRISRFERTKRGRLYRKRSNEVAVPEILDMTPHLEESDKQAGVEARYRLCGAINHAGTMGNGHFVSHVRGQDRQWYRLDDQTVTNSSIATLNDDPAKYGKHKFTPYVLAYIKIFDNDVTPDPPLRQLTPPPPPDKTEAEFRVRVNIAGQVFTMTRKLKDFCAAAESRDVNLHADIVDTDGDVVLEAEPLKIELVKKTSESNSTGSKKKKAKASPLRTPKKPSPETGLVTPSPTPIRTKTKTDRSKGEEKAKICKGRQELGGQAPKISSPLSSPSRT